MFSQQTTAEEKQIHLNTQSPFVTLPSLAILIEKKARCIRCLRLIETLNQSTRDSSSCWASLERIPRRRTGLEIKELLRILKRSCSDKSCLLTVALLREREKVSLERFTAYHTQNAKRWHTHSPRKLPFRDCPLWRRRRRKVDRLRQIEPWENVKWGKGRGWSTENTNLLCPF